MKIITAFILVLSTVALHSQQLDKYGVSEEGLPQGLMVGDTVNNLPLQFLDGATEQLYQYSSEKPTVVLFYRGEWCPVCSRHLSNLTDSLALIKIHANVIVVAPESKENMLKMAKDHPEYTYVLDQDEQIMNSFDVIFNVTDQYQKKIKTLLATDIAKHNDKEGARLPVPATYIVDKDGVIHYRHFDFNYKNRASAREILEALDKE